MSTEVLPLGALGDLPSFSILSGDAIEMDVNVSATVFPGSKPSDFGGFIGGCLSKAALISAAFWKILMSLLQPHPSYCHCWISTLFLSH